MPLDPQAKALLDQMQSQGMPPFDQMTVAEAREAVRIQKGAGYGLQSLAMLGYALGMAGRKNDAAEILERIKEIGVRRAVGATQKDIGAQFLSEAVMISLAGGIAGIIVGGILSFAIQRIAHINTIVSAMSVFVAFGVSVAVGLVFGIMPANKAAKQDPIVCLRYE